jgi:L,D-transpeptidase ErfK/SrfK
VIAGVLPAWGQPAPARPILVGGVFTYDVKRGDSLSLIGARYGVGPAALARQNDRALRDVLQPGEQLRIDNRHLVPAGAGAAIVINIPQRHLFLFGRDGALRAHYPVGLGRPDWQTPVGAFEITQLERDPTWDVPKSIQEEMRREGKPVIRRVPPCPENPLGRYWLRLSIGGIGIHGTNAPASVYTFQTHGCVRLHPDDVEDLFGMVSEGERGRLVYEPALLAQVPDGRVLAEVHRDVYDRSRPALVLLRELARGSGLLDAVDWNRLATVADLADGVATDVTRESSR